MRQLTVVQASSGLIHCSSLHQVAKEQKINIFWSYTSDGKLGSVGS